MIYASDKSVICSQADGALADHESGCDPNCPKILFHVCGTDGVTYNNECLLNLEACKSGKCNFFINIGHCCTLPPEQISRLFSLAAKSKFAHHFR